MRLTKGKKKEAPVMDTVAMSAMTDKYFNGELGSSMLEDFTKPVTKGTKKTTLNLKRKK